MWLARKVATLTRALGLDVVAMVDAAVSEAIGSESPSRVLDLTRAKVIEADPMAHQAAVEAQKRRRYVSLARSDEHGLRLLIARITAGDAAWIEAMVERVADILGARQVAGAALVGRHELRSAALGWLARPAELLQLLLENESDDDGGVDEAAEPSRATAFPADLLDALRTLDPERLRPRGVLYVHLHEASLIGETSGVARCEGLGAFALTQLSDLLSHARVSVRPVIDLHDQISVNAYEHPESVKERVHLTRVGDYFPYATSTARSADLDHATPYDATGPPGQTGTHNSGPLTRRHHRLNTHGRFRARQTGPGTYVWRTPRGQYLQVDRFGTHPLTPERGEMLLRASQVELRLVGALDAAA